MRMYIDTAIMENSIEVPQQIKTTIWPSYGTIGCISKEKEYVGQRAISIPIFHSVIHNSEELESN
jgi:hypothetical protein